MIGLLCFGLAILISPFRSKSRLEAENAVLRHQLIVLRRKMRGRSQLTNNDHWFFIQLYRWFPSILQFLTIIRPITSLAASIRPGPETIGLVQCTPNQVLDHRRHHACIAIPSADVLSRRAEKSS